MDYCEECGEKIYPDDERVSTWQGLYHFECAEPLGIGEEPSE